MKKKYLIILVAQSVLILVLLVFSFVQKAAADKAREDAVVQKTIADENMKKCLEQLENKR